MAVSPSLAISVMRTQTLCDSVRRGALALSVERDQYAQLRHDVGVLSEYGLTRALASAMDRTGILTRIGKAPALESLDLISLSKVSPVKDSVVKNLTAAVECESQSVADWIAQSADRIASILNGTEVHIDSLLTASNDLAQTLQNTDACVDAESVASLEVSAIPADHAQECMDAISSALVQMRPIDVTKLSDPDYVAKARDGLGELAQQTATITGFPMEPGDDLPQTDYQDGDPGSLGYTPEVTISLLDSATAFLSTLRGIVQEKGQWVQSLTNAASATPEAAPANEVLIAKSTVDAAVDSADASAAVANVDDSQTTVVYADDYGDVIAQYACLFSGLLSAGLKVALSIVAVGDAYASIIPAE